MNMPKSRDIQAKMPSPKVILNAFLASNCEGTEQLLKNRKYKKTAKALNKQFPAVFLF